MARGSANRVINPNINRQMNKGTSNVESDRKVEHAIEQHWESLPTQAKAFLLYSPNAVTFRSLYDFWSSPSMVEYTRGKLAGSASGACWFIALGYLKLGKLQEARAMTLNGSFILQCIDIPIEQLVELCGSEFNQTVMDYKVPLFCRGYHSVKTQQTMKTYLLGKRHMMETYSKTESHNVMDYVGKIGDDWGGKPKRRQKKPPIKAKPEGEQIQLILVDDSNKGEKCVLDIKSSTTLKTLFNDYAEKRGVSLRSMRFSYNGKTLFLSNIGKKTPDELEMQDQSLITVHGLNEPQEVAVTMTTPIEAKKVKKSPKRTKGKRKKKPVKIVESIKTTEDYKAEHSMILSKLHEEAQPRLKAIRTILNALHLERQPRKQKRKSSKKKVKAHVDLQTLPKSGVGGKAGKPYFVVSVGEVQNLYKQTKPSLRSSLSSTASTLDLHGCTKEEALLKMDDSLSLWVDSAMQASYPFVMQATIVCGCGNQVLSETVENWIRENAQVANAPRTLIPRW